MADYGVVVALVGQDQLSGSVRSATGSLRELEGQAGKSSGALGNLGGALGSLATGAAIAGVGALAAGMGVGVKAAGDLQQAVANISSIKPTIDTSAVFAGLNEMSTRVPQSAAQLGDSLYNIFSSIDVSTEQAMGLVETFAKGAVGAQTDAATFGTSILGVLNAYGLAAEDATHVSDVFFNTVAAGVVTGQELAGNLGIVTSSAKAAGVNIDQLGGLIAGVTKEGGPAAQNLNNLANFLTKIVNVDAQKAMRELGVAVTDTSGKFREMPDILTDLKDHLSTLTEVERTAALQKIFPDVQARQGAQVLLSQLDFVKGAIDTNVQQAGSAAQAYEKMSATFNSQVKILQNTALSILTTVGAAILPALTPLVKAFAESLPGAMQTASAAFGSLTVAGTPLVQFLKDLWGTVQAVFAHDWSPDSSINPVVNALGQLATFVRDTAIPNIQKLADTVRGVLADAFGWLTTTGWPNLQAAGGAFVDWWNGTGSPAFDAIVTRVRTDVGGALTEASDTHWPKLKTAANDFTDWWASTGQPKFADLADWLGPKVAPLIETLYTTHLAKLRAEFDLLGTSIDKTNGFFAALFKELEQRGVFDELNTAWTALKDTGNLLADAAQRVWSEVTKVTQPMQDAGAAAGTAAPQFDAFKTAVDATAAVIRAGVDMFTSLANALKFVAEQIDALSKANIGDVLKTLLAGPAKNVIDAWNALADIMGRLRGGGGGGAPGSGNQTTAYHGGAAGGDYAAMARFYAQKYGLQDPDRYVAQLTQESGLQPYGDVGYGTGPYGLKKSSAGALGIAQFIPSTAQAYANKLGISIDQFWQSIEAQVQAGALYMADLQATYGNQRTAEQAYLGDPGGPAGADYSRAIDAIQGSQGGGQQMRAWSQDLQTSWAGVNDAWKRDTDQFGQEAVAGLPPVFDGVKGVWHTGVTDAGQTLSDDSATMFSGITTRFSEDLQTLAGSVSPEVASSIGSVQSALSAGITQFTTGSQQAAVQGMQVMSDTVVAQLQANGGVMSAEAQASLNALMSSMTTELQAIGTQTPEQAATAMLAIQAQFQSLIGQMGGTIPPQTADMLTAIMNTMVSGVGGIQTAGVTGMTTATGFIATATTAGATKVGIDGAAAATTATTKISDAWGVGTTQVGDKTVVVIKDQNDKIVSQWDTSLAGYGSSVTKATDTSFSTVTKAAVEGAKGVAATGKDTTGAFDTIRKAGESGARDMGRSVAAAISSAFKDAVKAGVEAGKKGSGGNFFGHAGGGFVTSGVPTWVGEQGPEIFVPPSGGTIIPHADIGTLHRGDAVTNVTVNVTVEGNVTAERDLARAIAPVIREEIIKRGQRNAGDMFGGYA